MGDGTYSVAARFTTLSDQSNAFGVAMRKAGEFCHAKGMKVQNVPNPGSNDILFRCVGSLDAPPPAEPNYDDEGGH